MFGNAVTWERSFLEHSLQAYDELKASPAAVGSQVTILASGNAEEITPGYDLVYIDPPYINRQERYNRDDYWRRYNFLEGLAQYERWPKLINVNSDIKMMSPPTWFDAWSTRRSFKDRLFSHIDTHRRSIVALSYVTDAEPQELEIKQYFESKFKQLSVHSTEHSHALSKSRKRELLYIGHPR